MKTCNKCHVEKPKSEFYKKSTASDGLFWWCRDCHKVYVKAKYALAYTDKDFAHFLDMALGSLHETEYCIELCTELSHIRNELSEKAKTIINNIKPRLISLLKTLRKTAP